MFRSLPLGRAFGIPIYLHPTFALLPLYVLLTTLGDGWAAVALAQAVLLTVLGCVLLHELGHALMARLFGIATRDVTLSPIGGVARLESTGDAPLQEVAIALAGPFVNVVIALLLAPVALVASASGAIDRLGDPAALTSPLAFAAHYVAMVCVGNVILVAFNLLPAFPMDGGRVLRAVLSLGMDRLRATRIAAGIGFVAAAVLAALGVLFWVPGLILVGVFVAFNGQAELWAMKRLAALQAAEDAAAEGEPLPQDGFTGVAWDRRRGVWVRWVNGRVSNEGL